MSIMQMPPYAGLDPNQLLQQMFGGALGMPGMGAFGGALGYQAGAALGDPSQSPPLGYPPPGVGAPAGGGVSANPPYGGMGYGGSPADAGGSPITDLGQPGAMPGATAPQPGATQPAGGNVGAGGGSYYAPPDGSGVNIGGAQVPTPGGLTDVGTGGMQTWNQGQINAGLGQLNSMLPGGGQNSAGYGPMTNPGGSYMPPGYGLPTGAGYGGGGYGGGYGGGNFSIGDPNQVAANLAGSNPMGWAGAIHTGGGVPIYSGGGAAYGGYGGGGFGYGAPHYPTTGGTGAAGGGAAGGGFNPPPAYHDPTGGAGPVFGNPNLGNAVAGGTGALGGGSSQFSASPAWANLQTGQHSADAFPGGTGAGAQMPAGLTPQQQQLWQLQHAMQQAQQGGAGGAGGTGGAAGGTGAPNPGLVQQLAGSTQGALNSANQGNLNLLNAVLQGYGNLQGSELGVLGQTTNQQFQNLANMLRQNIAGADQNLTSRGLGNSTIQDSVNNGITSNYLQNLNQLNDSRLQQVLGIIDSLGQGALGQLSSVNQTAPNPAALPALAQGIGMAGGNPAVWPGSTSGTPAPANFSGSLPQSSLGGILSGYLNPSASGIGASGVQSGLPSGAHGDAALMSQQQWQNGGSGYATQGSATTPGQLPAAQSGGSPNPQLANGDLGLVMAPQAQQQLMNQILSAPTYSAGGPSGQNPFINTTSGGYNVPAGLDPSQGSALAALYQMDRKSPYFAPMMRSFFGSMYQPA